VHDLAAMSALVRMTWVPLLVLACTAVSESGDDTRRSRSTGALEPTATAIAPTCAELGHRGRVVVRPVDIGDFTSAAGDCTVTISNISSVFDFAADASIAAVIVDGNVAASIYRFDPPVRRGNGLHSPVNDAQGQGKYLGLYGIELCFDAVTEAPAEDAGEDAGSAESGGKTW
jgi:hypothetical protein